MDIHSKLTKKVFAVGPKAPLASTYDYMCKEGIRHAAVIESNKLVGILSDRDVLKHSTCNASGEVDVPQNLSVSDVMTVDIITCSEKARLGDVADIMVENHIDCLPIVGDNFDLQGLITSTDLIAELRRREGVTDKDSLNFDFKIHQI